MEKENVIKESGSAVAADFSVTDKRRIARAITYIESEYPEAENLLKNIYGRTGRAYRIGITGPPGAGKSTLTNQLTKLYRSSGKSVGIIAVDPTSPFTGGALLGDRVRMNDIGNDEGVFIRSMATRGSLGGLSNKAIDAADVLDAAGYDYIIFETVGVGQSELDIVRAADTTIVVLVPESGDAVQAMKAGLMEIADFFVVNKSDRPGAEQAAQALKTMLQFRNHDEHTWMPDIIKAAAQEAKGISETAQEIERHKSFGERTGSFAENRLSKMKHRIKEIVQSKLVKELHALEARIPLAKEYESAASGSRSPYTIAEQLLQLFKLELTERDEYGERNH